MSSLNYTDKKQLESLFGMRAGTVLNFSNNEFKDFFKDYDIEIYSVKYETPERTGSKANRLRTFWEVEPDFIVADVLQGLLDISILDNSESFHQPIDLWRYCEELITRLRASKVSLDSLKMIAGKLDLKAIDKQVKRMEKSIDEDPDLAIGTAKELIESCCKTILSTMGVLFDEKKLDVPQLSKLTLENLKLTPESIDPKGNGVEITKKILGSLGQISHNMAELRNLFGTGHGKEGRTSGLQPRHARLAVTCASAYVHFVFETFEERNKK